MKTLGVIALLATLVIVVALGQQARAQANELSLDHFQCYDARSDEPFAPRDIELSDQFAAQLGVTVLRPVLLCTPVNKNGEGFSTPDGAFGPHLTCYQTRDARGEEAFERHQVVVRNQFGQQILTVLKRKGLLCVPSEKAPAPDGGCGPGNPPCPPTQVCNRTDATCALPVDQVPGTCVPRPQLCLDIYFPVCGCDGVTYSNDCFRLLAGATLKHVGECP